MVQKRWGRSLLKIVRLLLWAIVLVAFLPGSTLPLGNPVENIRRFTRHIEFEFVSWTVEALWSKIEQFSLDVSSRMTEEERQAFVVEYFEQLRESQQISHQIEQIISDPNHTQQSDELDQFRKLLISSKADLADKQPVVESILQQQASFTIGELGIGFGGRIFPPLSFKFTPLPLSLIVSPRDVIRQEANIPLDADLDLDDKLLLENQVELALNVSSLVVNIGGVGTYPSMLLESSSLSWVTETVIHEWVHNYLTLRPLGINFLTNQDLRTMNETTAAILGREIAREMLERYYPEFVPPPDVPSTSPPSDDPPAFDRRAVLHETRITADALLAEGKVEEAEQYMETQRQYLWDNGHRIRKLNQAYFAFHGAYADRPGGAAGEDPVGDAVRELWDAIADPAEFLWTMSWMNDFSDLERTLAEDITNP
jgi:hypothetical protein